MNLRTPAAAKILGSVSLVLIAGGGWLFVLGPETEALGAMQEQIVAAGDQNGLLVQQLVILQKQAADLDSTRATAQALAAKFPPTADQPGLFQQVTAAATGAGIGPKDVTALTPTPPTFGAADPADPTSGVQPVGEGATNVARQTLTISVEGDYAATHDLLENLEDLPRAYLINSVSLSTGEGTTSFTTTIIGDMFVMPPAKAPGQGSPEDAADASALAASSDAP